VLKEEEKIKNEKEMVRNYRERLRATGVCVRAMVNRNM